MLQKEIILKQHYVPYKIIDGILYADSMEAFTKDFEKVVNVSEMTIKDLYEWLGY